MANTITTKLRRNLPILKKGGAHGPTNKALRKQRKDRMKKEVLDES
jgi:hypothetical protein